MIEVKNLTKKFDKLTALYDVSFRLQAGGVLGVLGQYGSGKSTLLSIISGSLTSSQGNVYIEGARLGANSARLRSRVGLMPEKPPLYINMTVGEYLQFVCELKGLKKNAVKEETSRLISLTALGESEGRIIKELSGLALKKLALCSALAANPPILLLDDPIRGLESAEAEEMITLIKSIIKGKTIVMTSEKLNECTDICEDIIIINAGRVVVNTSVAGFSEELHGSTRLKLRIVYERRAAARLFSDFEDITDIELQSSGERDAVDVVLTYPVRLDLRRSIWQHLSEKNIPVLEMKQINISLEDIYLQMSGER